MRKKVSEPEAIKIEPGKVDHPVWKQVNTWPKWMLDKYYAKSIVQKLSALPEAEVTAIKNQYQNG